MSFLQTLAHQLISTYGKNLTQVTVVFPNKRPSLFLNEELTRLGVKPKEVPTYTTISDLFQSLSDLELADPIKLICDLHKSFVSCTGINEKLDHFYGWGQILLADFDDVDKHLAPAERVFANLRNIHEYDNTSYLSQEQKDIIHKFFSNFNEDYNSELKQRFLSLWSHLYDIYLDFNTRLKAQGLAYEGSLSRQIIEDSIVPLRKHSARGGTTSQDVFERNYTVLGTAMKYIFAGFNLLLPVEQALIDSLGENAIVVQDTEEETPKEIAIISAPTNNVQAHYISTWLKENNRIAAGSKTAIVLADETLLPTVIHCLPPEASKVNITTGFPLSHTASATHGMTQDVLGPNRGLVLSSENIPHEEVFRDCKIFGTNIESQIAEQSEERNTKCCLSEASSLSGSENITVGLRARTLLEERNLPPKSPLEQEALYRLKEIHKRLQSLIDSGDLQVSDATLHRLLAQIIASTTIPFHGEPLEGIQIMGVLETRNLDFDHVLLLSCNEGILPKGANDTSFIPYSIRKAYDLTTVDRQVDIFHNYFRRLLQRASDVTILYNNATTDGKTGEMSQFMLQLLVESPHPIILKTLQTGQQPTWHQPRPVDKTPEVMEALYQRFSEKVLSPSALAQYLRCPLQFFYHYVAGLHEYEDEDAPLDNRLFGNIFHKAAHLLYSSLTVGLRDRTFSKEKFCSLTKFEIERAVDQAIKLELFHLEDPMAPMPSLNGLQLINREVIIKYLHQLLEIDRHLAPFTILALETPQSSECGQFLSFENVLSRITSSCGMFSERKDLPTVKVGGVVDRIDLITLPDGTERIRVVDYKTSNTRLRPLPDVAAIFDPANIKYHSDYYLQAILYSCMVEESAFLNQKEEKTSLSKNTPHEEVFRDGKIFGTNIESQIAEQSEERNTKCCLSEASSLSGSENITVGLRDRTFGEGKSFSSSVEDSDGKRTSISPCLLFIQHTGTDDYDPTLILGKTPITDVTEIKDEFMHHLTNLLTEIFSPSAPFLPTEDRSRCKSCPFSSLCNI